MPDPAFIYMRGLPSEAVILGNLLRLAVDIYDLNMDPVDPTTLTFKYRRAKSTLTVVEVFPTGIIRAEAGRYYFDLDMDADGVWAVRWEAAGNVIAASEWQITVKPTLF